MSIGDKILVTILSLVFVSSYGNWRYFLDADRRGILMKCWAAGIVVMWVWL